MVASAFDALNEVELTLDDLALMSTDLRAGRVRMGTLRAISTRLSRMRRRVAPQRGLFQPLTFITGFFGMNFGWMVAQIDTQPAFWLLGVGTLVVE